MTAMDSKRRVAFLEEPRLGVLTYLREDGGPIAVPLWFEWDGGRARFFSSVDSPKMKRFERDGRISLLVPNRPDEVEAWVAIDGTVSVHEDGALALAERLAARYWGDDDPAHQETLELWRKAEAALRRVEIEPTRIRSWVD